MMEHKGTVQLTSERLILRQFSMQDAEAMYRNWASDNAVTRYLTWPSYQNAGTAVSTLKDWTGRYSDPSFYQWAIVLKDHPEEPIGSISVVNDIDDVIRNAEIGYCIGRKWWGHSITAEALKTVMAFLFDEVGVNKVSARHDVNNPASGKVMMKCGMQYEGTLRQAAKNNQGVCDIRCYGLLANERQ